MSWIDAFLTAYNLVQSSGVPAVQRTTIDFINATVADDPANNRTIVTLTGSGASVTSSGIWHSSSGLLDTGAYRGTAGQALFTAAGGGDTAWASFSGDVTASTSTPGQLTVTKVQGVAFPVPPGSGTTVLTNTSGTLSWAASSSGFTALTAVDVTAADSSHTYVQSISGAGGAGGTVALNITALQFAAGQTSASFGQAAATGDVLPANLTLSPQGPFAGATTTGHKTPGSLVVNLANPVSGGNNGALVVKDNNATLFQVHKNDTVSGAGSYLYLGDNATTAGDWAIAYFPGSPSVTEFASAATGSGTNLQPSISFLSNGLVSIAGGTSSSNPANISADIALPNGSTHGGFTVTEFNGSSRPAFFRVDNGTAGAGYTSAMWLGASAAAATSTNWSIAFFPVAGPVSAGMLYSAPAATSSAIYAYESGQLVLWSGLGGTSPLIALNAIDAVNASVSISADATNTSTSVVLQAVALTGNRHITALNQIGGGITATHVPSGDGLTLVYRAATNPTSAPATGAGFELYADHATGNPYIWVEGAGAPFQIAAGGGGSFTAGGDLTGNLTTQYVWSLSGANGTGTQVALRSGVSILVTDGQPIIGDGTWTFMSTTAGGSLHLNGASVVDLFVANTLAVEVTSAALTLSNGVALTAPANQSVVTVGGVPLLATDGSGTILIGTNSASTSYFVATSGGGIVGMNGTSRAILSIANTTIVQASANAVGFSQPVGGFGVALTWQSTSINVTGLSTTLTLSSAQYQCPTIKFISSSTPGGGNDIAFPNVEAEWIIDLQGMNFGPGHLTLSAGASIKPITFDHLSAKFQRVICDGNSSLYSIAYA